MQKVLLITYYWPPAGGGGVQRWLKMSKYMRDYEIELTIYTPENPEYPAIDESTLNEMDHNLEVIKRPILEPYSIYKKFIGKKKEAKIYSGFINDKKSFAQSVSIWIRGNFFIPDARKFWIKPSIKYLTNQFKSKSYDAIISTGPPHSMHMIAMGLKRRFPKVKWIADFRDPWTNIDFYEQLKLSKRADLIHRRMEKNVLQEADKVVTVGWTLAKELEQLANIKNVKVIPNGYDHLDFAKRSYPKGAFSIMHLGSMNKDRNPETFWIALSDLKIEKILPEVEIIGQVDVSVVDSVKKHNLNKQVNFLPFIPHNQAVIKMMEAHVLLLVINKTPNAAGILTGKLFEYLGAKRPIIIIGPDVGDVKELLKDFSHTFYIEYGQANKCKDVIRKLWEKIDTIAETETSRYSRKNLAGEYCEMIKDCVN